LLDTGQVTEAVLPVSSLPDVRLWVGNSLRGLIPARFIG
jgi:4-amino-4-deoxychorismate lyase